MRQILGNGLEKAFDHFHIAATLMFKGDDFEVWQLCDNDYRLLEKTDEDEWGKSWNADGAWWRYGRCVLEGCSLYEYKVNGQTMRGWGNEHADEDEIRRHVEREYPSFMDWLLDVFSLSTEKHIACFAISLADANGISLAEFVQRYQPRPLYR